jgi:pyruvate dehydrogenase E2 component (dihydrolipoamide acetyltransferase)
MAEVIRMPKMSDTMTEGVIVSWLKKVGDDVKPGDILAEVETDKATMELENYVKGTLLHIGIEAGGSVPVDAVIAVVGKQGEDISGLLDGGAPAAPAKKEAEAKEEQPAAEKETAQPAKTTAAKAADTTGDSRLKASPLAKKIADEKGIDISQVSGSGDNGRIVKRDVESFTPAASKKDTRTAGVAGTESYEDVPLSQMRKAIARRLSESKNTAPHFYLTMSINMDKAIEARKAMLNYSDVKISVNDIIIKAVAASLRRHPAVNASWLGDKIRHNHHIHIGVAVAIEDGLIVPVVKFADNKSISQISAEVKDLAARAKNKKLQPAEFEGNTFTISNLGMFGIEEFTAIINPPDSCILAIGAAKETAIVENGQVKVASIMKVTMSCDHRSVDGAVGAAFLQTLKELLENPVKILV